jgi:hypothetical protein
MLAYFPNTPSGNGSRWPAKACLNRLFARREKTWPLTTCTMDMRGTGGPWATVMYHTHTPSLRPSASVKKIRKTWMLHSVQVLRDGKQRQAPCYISVNGPFNNRSGGVPLTCSKTSRLERPQWAITGQSAPIYGELNISCDPKDTQPPEYKEWRCRRAIAPTK